MTDDLIPWICDICGQTCDIEPHFPHDAECARLDDGCYCDFVVCPDCCWATECEEVMV